MEIYSSSGVLQADCNLLSYFCRKTATTSTQAGIGGNTIPSSIIIPIAGQGYTYPIVAFASSGTYVARSGVTAGGDYVFSTDAATGVSMDYYIFDYSPALPSSSFGIELYNTSTQITFSSNYFPMQGVSILTSGSYTATSRTLAVGLPGVGGFRIAGPIEYFDNGVPVAPGSPYTDSGYQNDQDLYGGRVTNSNQTVEYGNVSWDDVYFGPVPGLITVPPDWNYNNPIIAIDVTNIPLNTTFF